MREKIMTRETEELYQELMDYAAGALQAHGVEGDWYVAGGAVANILRGFPFDANNSDIDIYFRSEPTEPSAGHWDLAHVTSSAVSLSTSRCVVQLIKRYFGDPEDIMRTFDLSCCECVATPDGIFCSDRYCCNIAVTLENVSEATLDRIVKYKVRGHKDRGDKEIQRTLERLLQAKPHEIRTYYDGQETTGVTVIRNFLRRFPKYSNLVVDVIMSTLSGSSVIVGLAACSNTDTLLRIAERPGTSIETIVALRVKLQTSENLSSEFISEALAITSTRLSEQQHKYPEFFL